MNPNIMRALFKRMLSLEADLLEAQRDIAAEADGADPNDPISTAKDRAGWAAAEARRSALDLERAMAQGEGW